VSESIGLAAKRLAFARARFGVVVGERVVAVDLLAAAVILVEENIRESSGLPASRTVMIMAGFAV
jgi:hypothetical protein